MSDWKPEGVAPCVRRIAAPRAVELCVRIRPSAALPQRHACLPIAGAALVIAQSSWRPFPARRSSPAPRMSAAPAAARPRHAQPVFVFGIPVDFILFGADAAWRRDLPPQDAAGRADRACRHRRLQAHLHRLQVRHRLHRPRAAHAARGGDPREPVPAADGLCDPLASLREEPHPRRDAGIPAGRMDGRAGAARHRVRAVGLPRQHRGRADRRHDGAARVQGQSPHRLSRGDRGSVERRRLRQRRRRHHDHHDVDRRHQPAVGGRSLYRRGRRPSSYLRHPGRAPAAPLFADPEGRAARPADRLDVGRDRRARSSSSRSRANVTRQPAIPGDSRGRSGDRASRCGS